MPQNPASVILRDLQRQFGGAGSLFESETFVSSMSPREKFSKSDSKTKIFNICYLVQYKIVNNGPVCEIEGYD